MSTAQRARRCLLIYTLGLLAVLGVSQAAATTGPTIHPVTTNSAQP